MKLNLYKNFVLFFAIFSSLYGCAVIDYSDKISITNKCLVLIRHDTTIYKYLTLTGYKYAIMPSYKYTDKQWHPLDGNIRKKYKVLPAGTKIKVIKYKLVKGITDGPPFYVRGTLFDKPNDLTFDIPINYFLAGHYPEIVPEPRKLEYCS